MSASVPTAADRDRSALDAAARAIIVERLRYFAAGCLTPSLVWVTALSWRLSYVRPPAILTLAFQTTVMGIALGLARRPDIRHRIETIVLVSGLLLAVSSIALFVIAGSAGELLGFVLFTICAMAALLFPWGWRLELGLTVAVLVLYALAAPALHFILPAADLAPVVLIATALCVAIAEGNTRSFEATVRRRWSEEAAHHALAVSRDTYRDIMENARDFIWATDLAGHITYLNEAGARILGFRPAEILGRSADEYIVTPPGNPEPNELRAHLTSGGTLPPTVLEWRTVHGRTWVETVAYAVHDRTGATIGFRGISRDVTERREAERALRESEARYRGLVESQEELIYRADLAGNLTFLNEACRRKYGVEGTPLAALSFLAFVHPDDVADARAALQAVTRGGRYRRASRGRTPEGWRWIEWEVCGIADGAGVVVEIQGVGHDVTERRAADEALQRSLVTLREREEQLRRMGHHQVAIREEERKRLSFDLHDGVCQELVGIGILIESVRERGVSQPADATLVRTQAYLRTVAEHLRLLARELRPLQLADLGLGECLRALAVGMATDAVVISVDVPPTLPPLGEETAVAVYRVAQEALANAVRHARPRQVTLTLAAAAAVLTLEVHDDGCGFDHDALRPAALGLIAMEERATALGGTLHIDSAPGAGTTIRLACPLGAGG